MTDDTLIGIATLFLVTFGLLGTLAISACIFHSFIWVKQLIKEKGNAHK